MSKIQSLRSTEISSLLADLHGVTQQVQPETHIFHSPQGRRITIRRSSRPFDSFVEATHEGLDAERATSTPLISREPFLQVNGQGWHDYSLPKAETIVRHQWGSKSLATISKGKYQVSWDLPFYVRTCFPAAQSLDTIMAITGGDTIAFATDVAKYCSKTWPVIGPVLLQAVNEFLGNSKLGM
jgi:hypothetical protein